MNYMYNHVNKNYLDILHKTHTHISCKYILRCTIHFELKETPLEIQIVSTVFYNTFIYSCNNYIKRK